MSWKASDECMSRPFKEIKGVFWWVPSYFGRDGCTPNFGRDRES